MTPNFFIDYKAVCERIESIDPLAYARTRNYLGGAVSYLSPFITHGVISTDQVAQAVRSRSSAADAAKLLSELAWREFFHRVLQVSGEAIFSDMRQSQVGVSSTQIPAAIVSAATGVNVIDDSIKALTDQGYMHNHARLWTASLACNIAATHWYQPARWMYYHLLDGDLASNSLSWQWVAGTFSQRKYIANQQNINRYSESSQFDTFLDYDYDSLSGRPVPDVLVKRTDLNLSHTLPASEASPIESSKQPVFLYSIWSLDPVWRQRETGMRILLIEPDMHREFALSPLRWRFITHCARMIDGLQIYVGTVDSLFPNGIDKLSIYTREYPATQHWPGERDQRTWCFAKPQRTLTSFSRYWNEVRKESEYFS